MEDRSVALNDINGNVVDTPHLFSEYNPGCMKSGIMFVYICVVCVFRIFNKTAQ